MDIQSKNFIFNYSVRGYAKDQESGKTYCMRHDIVFDAGCICKRCHEDIVSAMYGTIGRLKDKIRYINKREFAPDKPNDELYSIYRILLNGRSYYGITNGTLSRRLDGHISLARKEKNKSDFQEALLSKTKKEIEIDVIATAPSEKNAREIETQLIINDENCYNSVVSAKEIRQIVPGIIRAT